MRITKPQQIALAKIYARKPMPMSYRAFRKTAQATFGCDGAIVVHWCGMWLCIEKDGYTHS